ncbi:MAG: acetolactate synthase small subunit [candidate division KSB1 bacterium]|nr:acetolactate synthase small subunit [candidate division KSB1 bacterium]
MRHIINLEVENNAGVLARIAGLFSARGFNIDSLSVANTDSDDISRMTLVVQGDDAIIEQVNKQLNKLIDVIRVTDITKNNYVDRELLLVRVNCPPNQRADVSQVAEIFGAKVVDIGPKTLTLEVIGSEQKIDAFVETVRPYGLKEVARSGPVTMLREAAKRN